MRYLVATKETQGQRNNDFSFTIEGELVKLGFECGIDEDPDSECGCRRSMEGIDSLKGTTTIKIAEVDLTSSEILQELIMSEKVSGWRVDEEFINNLRKQVEFISYIANLKPLGTVYEKRGHIFQARK